MHTSDSNGLPQEKNGLMSKIPIFLYKPCFLSTKYYIGIVDKTRDIQKYEKFYFFGRRTKLLLPFAGISWHYLMQHERREQKPLFVSSSGLYIFFSLVENSLVFFDLKCRIVEVFIFGFI